MVKYTLLLLNSFCAFSLVCQAQSYTSNSIFGTLFPFNSSTTFLAPKELRWTISANKMSYSPKAYQTEASLLTHYASIQLAKQEWDPQLKRMSVQMNACIYASKNLRLIPSLCLEQMQIPEYRLPASWQGKLLLQYQMHPSWRLASQIMFTPTQNEINQIGWITGIQFKPNPMFEIECNVRKQTKQESMRSIILIKWVANPKLNLCVGRSSEGEFIWHLNYTYKKIEIGSLLSIHPLLGSSYNIGMSGPLLLRSR